MRDNLARKPRLTLINAANQPLHSIETIACEIDDEPGQKPTDTFRWVSSLLVVLVVYSAPLVWWLIPDQHAGANLPPPAAMVVELAPTPVAPASQPDMPPGPEQAEATPSKPEPQPEPEPEQEIPPAPPAIKPEVAVKPKPELNPKEQPTLKETLPVEEPTKTPPEDKPANTASAPPDAPQEDLEAAAPTQGVSVPTVNSNAIPTWQNQLMIKLNKAKRYPTQARRYRHQGVAYLRFTIDRKGNVLKKSIEQSAGYPLLDKETLELIDRAQPLPKPPVELKGEQLEFVVPVEFFLNR